MNSKDKGNLGQALTLAEFIKYNIPVAIPFGDNNRYDLIADFNGKLNRIQIKYCNQQTENNSIICPCSSSTNHTTNKHYTTYVNDIDKKFATILTLPIEFFIVTSYKTKRETDIISYADTDNRIVIYEEEA